VFYKSHASTYNEFSCEAFKSNFTNAKRLVFTSDGTDISLYIDGELIDSITPTTTNLKLSRLMAGYSTSSYLVDATASDFQIYDTAWTQADVTFDYNNPQHLVTDNSDSTIALSNLKGYWHLSEGDGAINYDSSGEGNDGTINGATWEDQQATIPQLGLMDWAKSTPVADEITLIADPNNPSEDILGNSVRLREHSLNLDGIGYAEVPDADNLDMSSGFSVSFWRKLDTDSDGIRSAILSKGVGLTTGVDKGFAISMFNNTLYVDINTSNGRFANQKSLTIDGRWVFVTTTYTANERTRVYIDDNTTPSVSNTISGTINESHSIVVGADENLSWQDANLIDDVIWYDRVLTQKEITQNYKAGLNKHKASSSFSDDFSSDYGF